MDSPATGLLTFLLLLLGGGGKDLLDYLPTDFYWKQKEAVVDVEMLRKEIAPPARVADVPTWIDDLGAADAAVRDAATAKLVGAGQVAIEPLRKEAASDDVEVARRARALVTQIVSESQPKVVRRLMSIRTIGEKKFADALPDLRNLTEDADPFIAQYAAEAIARIEDKPLAARQPEDLAASMEKDLSLLPENSGAVGQIRLAPGLAPTFEETLKRSTFADDQRKQRLEMMSRTVLELAESVGDVRIDGLTFGISNDIGDHSGSLILIARGQFSPEAAGTASTLGGAKSRRSGETDVFFNGPEAAFFFPSSNRAVFFASPLEGDAGIAGLNAMIAAVKAGKGTLAKSKDLPTLIEAADRSKPIWAVAKISPEMKGAPMLAGIDTIDLSATQPKPTRLEISVAAKAPDAAGAKRAAQDIKASVDEALKGLKPIAEFMKPLRPLRDFLMSVKPTPAGDKVSATAWIDGSMTDLFMFSEAPYTEPVVQPAPGEPQPKN